MIDIEAAGRIAEYAVPLLLTVGGAAWRIVYRMAKQDVAMDSRFARQDAAIEWLMRDAEARNRRSGSDPPPYRPKLATLDDPWNNPDIVREVKARKDR